MKGQFVKLVEDFNKNAIVSETISPVSQPKLAKVIKNFKVVFKDEKVSLVNDNIGFKPFSIEIVKANQGKDENDMIIKGYSEALSLLKRLITKHIEQFKSVIDQASQVTNVPKEEYLATFIEELYTFILLNINFNIPEQIYNSEIIKKGLEAKFKKFDIYVKLQDNIHDVKMYPKLSGASKINNVKQNDIENEGYKRIDANKYTEILMNPLSSDVERVS